MPGQNEEIRGKGLDTTEVSVISVRTGTGTDFNDSHRIFCLCKSLLSKAHIFKLIDIYMQLITHSDTLNEIDDMIDIGNFFG